MFKMFNIKLNKKGFTLMELVVSTAIMGTLAAFAVPAYLDTQENTKGTKADDTMNLIASALVNAYMEVADQGYGTTNDIAEFTQTTGDDWVDLTDNLAVINYGTAQTVSMVSIFPSGVPTSPFGDGWQIMVNANTNGQATWGGNPPVLTFTQNPTFDLRDKIQQNLTAQFQLN